MLLQQGQTRFLQRHFIIVVEIIEPDNGIATLNALMDKSSEAHAARLKQNLQEIQYLQKRYELGFIAGQN